MSLYGPRPDNKELCNARIVFGDDYGDNSTTFKCDLPKGHTGKHTEHGDMGTLDKPQPYMLEWEGEGEKYDFVDEE